MDSIERVEDVGNSYDNELSVVDGRSLESGSYSYMCLIVSG